MAIELQRRDLMMIKFIYTFGAATYDQIRKKFFQNQHKTAAYGRIQKLRKHGYLETFWHLRDNRPQKCIKLKEKTAPLLERLWKERINNPLIGIESLTEALCMQEISLRFEKLKMFKRMLSLRVIQGSSILSNDPKYSHLSFQRCSGILELEKDGDEFRFPIELEFVRRVHSFYERKLREHYSNSSIDGVIVLCLDHETMDLIAKADREVCKDEQSIVYLALASSVIESSGSIILTSVSGTRIGLT